MDIYGEHELVSDVEFVYKGEVYNCNENEMAEAMNGAVILNFRLIPEDKTSMTDVGLSFNKYFNNYEIYLNNHLKQNNLSRSDGPAGVEVWSSKYFDAMWAMGLALNNSIPILEDAGLSLSNDTHQEMITSTIREQLLSMNFKGLSADIYFHKDTREVPTIVNIHQVSNSSLADLIGFYYEGNLTIKDESQAFFVEPVHEHLNDANFEVVTVFFTVALLIFILTGCLHLTHLIFQHSKSFRAQSPHFSHFVFSGCYLYIISSLLESAKALNWLGMYDFKSLNFLIKFGLLCNIIIWCLTLGTSLIFGTVCVLSWRLYRIFNHYVRPGKFISDPVLVCLIVLLISINTSVLLAWNTVDPLLPHFEVMDEAFNFNRISYWWFYLQHLIGKFQRKTISITPDLTALWCILYQS